MLDLVSLYVAALEMRAIGSWCAHSLSGARSTIAPYGYEPALCAALGALRRSDWFAPSWRDSVGACSRGLALSEHFRARRLGAGQGSRTLHIALEGRSTAGHLTRAVGLARGLTQSSPVEVDESSPVVLATSSPSSAEDGDFHSALHFAGVWRSPVVVLCNATSRESEQFDVGAKTAAYGVELIRIELGSVSWSHGGSVSQSNAEPTPALEAIDRALELARSRRPVVLELVRSGDLLDTLRDQLREESKWDDEREEIARLDIERRLREAWRGSLEDEPSDIVVGDAHEAALFDRVSAGDRHSDGSAE